MKSKILQKRIIEYTFKQKKGTCGMNVLSGVAFYSPDSDGPEMKKVFEALKPKQVVTMVMTVEEEA
jgi:hypothetical protein